ncbi:MAG: hypothetical protein PVG03_11345 [Desulfarculaceae bacterium]
MKRRVLLLVYTVCLLILADQCWSQSPFRAEPGSNVQSTQDESGFIGALLVQINLWQRQINQKMSELGREVKQTGSLRPVLFLLALSLLYGLLHAAGPGHGKIVVLSYAVTRGRLSAALAVGNLTAIVHGLSGITFVLMVKFVLDARMSGTLTHTTQNTQVISYGLLSLFGAVLLGRSLWSWRAKAKEAEAPKRDVPPWLMAVAAGLIPCPGVVLIMLFCLAQGMLWLGVLMASAMSLGMAITITAVAVTAYAGKSLSLKAASLSPTARRWSMPIMETGAALALLLLGLLFLAASL